MSNVLRLPGTLYSLLHNISVQEKFLQKNIYPRLEAASKINDGSLDEEDFKKITNYYGLAVPAILGESLCLLRGFKMSEKERTALTYQGAMTGLFDDFFDKRDKTDETVKTLIERPQELTGNNESERMFLESYSKFFQTAADFQLSLKYQRKVYEAQIESRKQSLPGLNHDEILDLTIKKGGVSVLFYRSVMAHPFLPGEEEALYKMGGLMQFGNDVFDIYKDRNSNIYTIPTTTKKVDELRTTFKTVMQESFASVHRSGYLEKNVKKFLHYISMCLCSRCFVFFDQLENKERSTNGAFALQEYSRDDLVCDMEKGSNKWKTIIHYVKTPV